MYYVLILDGAPQALDEDVVQRPPAPVHADGDPGVQEHPRERLAGELRPLVGVEHRGPDHGRRRASSRQSTQNPASRVLDSPQASTRREYQSITAALRCR